MKRAGEPPSADPTVGPHRRYTGGSRRPACDRVVLVREGREQLGWALNVSRGGVRVVLEDPVEVNLEYSLAIGENASVLRPVRVAWVQAEAGGQIAGLQFLDAEGTIPPFDLP